MSDDGAIVSEKLAELYGVKAGDKFTLTDQNGHRRSIKVSKVAEMNVGHYLFMSKKSYQKIFDDTVSNNAFLVILKIIQVRTLKIWRQNC